MSKQCVGKCPECGSEDIEYGSTELSDEWYILKYAETITIKKGN